MNSAFGGYLQLFGPTFCAVLGLAAISWFAGKRPTSWWVAAGGGALILAAFGEYLVDGRWTFWFWVMWILWSVSTLIGTVSASILVGLKAASLPRSVTAFGAVGGAVVGAVVGAPLAAGVVCGLFTTCTLRWP